MTTEKTNDIDGLLEELEPVLVAGQFNQALKRLKAHFENVIAISGPQAGRALTEKVHLIAGDRRVKAVSVDYDRRRTS